MSEKNGGRNVNQHIEGCECPPLGETHFEGGFTFECDFGTRYRSLDWTVSGWKAWLKTTVLTSVTLSMQHRRA